MDELLNGVEQDSQTATVDTVDTNQQIEVAPEVSSTEPEQQVEQQDVSEQQNVENTQQESQHTQETKETQQHKKPPRYVPYGYLKRIKEERDELRQRLEEQSRILEEIQKKLLKDDEVEPEEEDEDLVTKLLENPREVLRKELSKQILPLQIEIKAREFESILNSMRSKYKDFQQYEPRMVELSRELYPPDRVPPDILANPAVLERLYMLAKAEKMDEIIALERKKAQEEALKKEQEKDKSVVETGKGGKSVVDYANLSLAELEKLLPKAEK